MQKTSNVDSASLLQKVYTTQDNGHEYVDQKIKQKCSHNNNYDYGDSDNEMRSNTVNSMHNVECTDYDGYQCNAHSENSDDIVSELRWEIDWRGEKGGEKGEEKGEEKRGEKRGENRRDSEMLRDAEWYRDRDRGRDRDRDKCESGRGRGSERGNGSEIPRMRDRESESGMEWGLERVRESESDRDIDSLLNPYSSEDSDFIHASFYGRLNQVAHDIIDIQFSLYSSVTNISNYYLSSIF
jgi:hypothetical protein